MKYRIYLCCTVFFISALNADWRRDLEEHIQYWRDHGQRDWRGQPYDADPAKAERLLNGLRAENPAAAAEMQPKILPNWWTQFAERNTRRNELESHITYWQQNGPQDEVGRRYDGDVARGQWLLNRLREIYPEAAAEYAPRMLPDPAALYARQKIAAARAEVQKHIDYWKANGAQDYKGRRYDGDWNRGQALLSELAKLDAAQAQEMASFMLPGPACLALAQHIDYWLKNGVLKDGKAYDKDWNKSSNLLQQCKAQSPAFAPALEQEMLPPSALEEWKEHVDYWTEKGNVDLDPARGDALYKAAYSINSAQADAIKARAPKNLFEYTGQFLKDIAEGKVPEAFKIKGKISNEINKVPPILDETAQAVFKIPQAFIEMYTELGTKKYDLQSALRGIATGKKSLADASKETQDNALIPQELKEDLLQGFEAAQKALPEIERVLNELYAQIDSLLPGVVPQQGETADQFKVKIKDAAFAKTNQEIEPSVKNVLDALNRQYEGWNLAQSLATWAKKLNDINV